jgi:carboxymethylenebutenolidase
VRTMWRLVGLVAVVVLVGRLALAAKPSASRDPYGADTAQVVLTPGEHPTTAFVAYPGGSQAAAGIIVVHEWWGSNGQIRGIARRLARQGYVAIVPDLYHGRVTDDPEEAHELSRGLEDAPALADLQAARAWLRAQPRTAKSRIGVVGFCMGGRLSELLALDSPDLSAAVMFYGPPETDPQRLATLHAPLQGHFGADDQGITAERVDALRAGLANASKSAEIYVYPGAGHAFMHDGRSSFRPDAARQAWSRMLAFLQKNLKG